jgi:serine/threonine-protein kinase
MTPLPTGRSRGAVLALAGLAAAALLIAIFALWPRTGTLVVTVAGPGKKPIDAVQVLVDGEKRCEASPCNIGDLKAGPHYVKVTAAGYQPTADTAVKVESGDQAVLDITLERASDGTGIRVTSEASGLKLYVDGKEIGPLPQELKDMTAGEHKLRIEGERYAPYEKSVVVKADEMQTIEPKLKVIKGLVTIKAGENADGADVVLVTGRDRRPIPKLPFRVEFDAEKSYTIVATKRGYAEYKEKISFDDGQAEKTYVINLSGVGSASDTEPDTETTDLEREPAPPPKRSLAPRRQSAPKAPKAPAPAAAGDAFLNLNSLPVSNVILDGRPLGATPKLGVKVKPGAHTVVFVHAEHGRKVKSVSVDAGKTATAAVKFP